MKILKCPVCNHLIDSKDIKTRSSSWNPFKRKELKCLNCGSELKPKSWLVALFLLWVIVGIYFIFSEYESPCINLLILGTLGLLVGLMRFGLSHESV